MCIVECEPVGVHFARPKKEDDPWLAAIMFLIFVVVLLSLSGGCIERQPGEKPAPFEKSELNGALAILIDTSGSFDDIWNDKAHKLFLELSDRFFTESMGTETKLVIAGLSGSQEVILFEGRPGDLRQRFRTPQELAQFLKEKSDPRTSQVYEATRRTVDYLRSLSGVSAQTRLMTVVLSDMQDTERDPAKKQLLTEALIESLKQYGEQGGALALYYVAEGEKERVYELLRRAEFPSSHYVVEGELSASPQLPRFE